MPALCGKEKTLTVLNSVNLAALLLLFIGLWSGALPLTSWPLAGSVLYCGWYLGRARKLDIGRLRALSYIAVDGETIVWLLLVVLGNNIVILP